MVLWKLRDRSGFVLGLSMYGNVEEADEWRLYWRRWRNLLVGGSNDSTVDNGDNRN